MALIVVAATACGGQGREVGLVSGGGSLPPKDGAVNGPPLSAGDPIVPPTSAPLGTSPPDVAAPPPLPPVPPVPLPSDSAAVVVRLSWGGGYPFPGGSLIEQPTELQAGGRLVRPAPRPPADPPSASHRLEAFEVPVSEVQAMVAAAEDAGATVPPADLGHDPDLADGGALVLTVDRPGLRSELVVRDPIAGSNDARGLTPDQMSRRRAVLDLVTRLRDEGRPTGRVRSYIRVVGFLPEMSSSTTTTQPPTDLRTWTGPALRMNPRWGCVDVPVADLDRQVPTWSSATSVTSWRAGSEVLRMEFYDATSATDGCAPS